MTQNKILSLEDIEEIQNDTDKIGDNIIAPKWANVPISELNALLATARAYHEAVKGERQYSCCCKGFYPSSNGGCFNCGHDEDSHSGLIECCNKVDVEYREKHLASEDKPHAPTIKVMIGALSNGIGMQWDGQNVEAKQVFSPESVIHSLESILKDLNN